MDELHPGSAQRLFATRLNSLDDPLQRSTIGGDSPWHLGVHQLFEVQPLAGNFFSRTGGLNGRHVDEPQDIVRRTSVPFRAGSDGACGDTPPRVVVLQFCDRLEPSSHGGHPTARRNAEDRYP